MCGPPYDLCGKTCDSCPNHRIYLRRSSTALLTNPRKVWCATALRILRGSARFFFPGGSACWCSQTGITYFSGGRHHQPVYIYIYAIHTCLLDICTMFGYIFCWIFSQFEGSTHPHEPFLVGVFFRMQKICPSWTGIKQADMVCCCSSEPAPGDKDTFQTASAAG